MEAKRKEKMRKIVNLRMERRAENMELHSKILAQSAKVARIEKAIAEMYEQYHENLSVMLRCDDEWNMLKEVDLEVAD